MSNQKDTTKTVKSVLFKIELEGRGGVNYDDAKLQKSTLANRCGIPYSANENISRLKKIYVPRAEKDIEVREWTDENGEKHKIVIDVDAHPKISGNCLRSYAFQGCSKLTPQTWVVSPIAACDYITSPAGYLHGYLDAGECNKTSAVTISDAPDYDAVITEECFVHSGHRDSTSFYVREQVGDTHYTGCAIFDVKEAQFMSLDVMYGRQSVPDAYTEGKNILEQAFVRRYGRVPYTKGVYTDHPEIFGKQNPELGLLFDNDYVNDLLKAFANALLDIDIRRKDAFAKTTSVEMTVIYEGGMPGESVTLTREIVDNLPKLDFHCYYAPGSEDEWVELRKEFFEKQAKDKEDKDEKKKKKEEARKRRAEEKKAAKAAEAAEKEGGDE